MSTDEAFHPFNLERLDPSNTQLISGPPDIHVPPYRTLRHDGWRIDVSILAANKGFWTTQYPISQIAMLVGPIEEEDEPATWMSTTAFEIESQTIGLEAAYGTTVIFGFGMGWLAVNVALRDAVERVIVVERNPTIIEISKKSGVFDGLPPEALKKIEIVQGDALEWRPDGPVDTLQADIWPRMFDHSLLPDVQRMAENVRPKALYFWGQEPEFYRHAVEMHGPEVELDWPMIRHIVEERIQLPLILPDWPDYPERIMKCIRHFGPSAGHYAMKVAPTG
jgi:hypothetical protein